MKCVAKNKVRAGLAGGVEAIIKTINAHINKIDVCKAGCGALFAVIDENG